VTGTALTLGDLDVEPEPETVPRRHLVVTSAQGMRIRVPKWLYELRIPTDAISLLAGREGIGKSTIAFDVAARVTRGLLPGRYLGQPRGVGVIASEDSWESVILPRLIAAGADRSRVHRIEARTEENQLETVSAPADLDDLARACAEHDIVLLILDPVMSVIHGSLDTHKDREVRRALDPLARFCGEQAVAVLGLIHVNKSGSSDPLNSVMASRAFTAVARSVLYCIVDPEAEEEDRYLFGHPKSNLGPKQPTLVYRLIECKLEIDEPEDPTDAVIVTSRVVWEGVDGRSIRDAMEPPRERAPSEPTVRIVEWLAEQGRTVPAAEIREAFPDIKRGTLDKHLSRLVRRGLITRPLHGHYGLPARSGTQSGTSLETSFMPEVPELPEDHGDLTDLADLAPSGTPEQVPERVPEPGRQAPAWATDVYDRER
jgi:hypothetical protein